MCQSRAGGPVFFVGGYPCDSGYPPFKKSVWTFGDTTGCGKTLLSPGYQARKDLRDSRESAVVVEGNNPGRIEAIRSTTVLPAKKKKLQRNAAQRSVSCGFTTVEGGVPPFTVMGLRYG